MQNFSTYPLPKLHPLALAVLGVLAYPTAFANTDDNVGEPHVTLAPETIIIQRNGARYSYIRPYDEITALKTDAYLDTTPQSINVVTRRHLDEREPIDVAETLAYTSGVQGGYRGENGNIEMTVRGIGNKHDGGGSALLVDGMSYATSLEMNPYLIDSIDVLKGGISALYGKSSPGGVVNINLKKASGSNEKEIALKVGANNRTELGIDIDNKLNDKVDYRLIGAVKKLEWQAGDAKQESHALSSSINWAISDKANLQVFALHENQPKAGDRNFLVAQGLLTPVNGKYIPYDFFGSDPNFHDIRTKQTQLGYQFDYDVNDNLRFSQKTRYGKYSDILKSVIVWYPDSNNPSTLVRKARMWDYSHTSFQTDNSVNFKLNTGGLSHSMMAGVDYTDIDRDETTHLGDAPSIDWQAPIYGVNIAPPALRTKSKQENRQIGVYAQNEMAFDKWHFLVGGRYDKSKTSELNLLNNQFTSQKDSKFTWRAGALYAFDNGVSPYISYGTSFVPAIGTDANGNALKPTTSTQAELGVKYQITPRVLLTGSLFDIKQQNLVQFDRATRSNKQIGEVQTLGAEIELQGDITPNWGLSGSYTYLDKTIKRDTDPSNVGKTHWNVPKHNYSLWTDYRFSGTLDGLSVGVGMRHQDKTYDRTNTLTVPSYTLWDLKVGYRPAVLFPRLKGITLQLNVQNVGDKHYVASCSNADSCFYGKERQIIGSVSYRW
ncbi:Ferric hydroxamate uptake [Moraxella lacunata]|uniref:Ferric hydroxamate uptake n=1 Tax=Moraxella lacunata TaxID=477 RepID=A0A378TSL0_MORLA|nr:TonB-dependent siderophore receptor [Moraxella lacunata]STZ62852.1 Ferric hydroxamate uptake [Moraxella lacunata]